MSDAPATDGLTTGNLPDSVANQPPPAAATPPVQPPAAPVGSADELEALPEDQAVFSRSYVEKVRGEAQRYREAARSAERYNDVFGQYDEGDQQVWLDLARTWATDPNRAAQVMQQIAGNVLGEAGVGADDAGGAVSPDDPLRGYEGDEDELTPQRVQELIDQQFTAREAKAAEAAAIEEVYAEVRQAGYDPSSAEGFAILWDANHATNGDIAAAVKLAKVREQKIIDGYVQGRASGTVPMPAAHGVQATSVGEPITNLDDAKRATDAFLRERRGA